MPARIQLQKRPDGFALVDTDALTTVALLTPIDAAALLIQIKDEVLGTDDGRNNIRRLFNPVPIGPTYQADRPRSRGPVSAFHRLTDIDEKKRVANCSQCDAEVKIVSKGRTPTGFVKWSCYQKAKGGNTSSKQTSRARERNLASAA